jgi:hypothetical protein
MLQAEESCKTLLEDSGGEENEEEETSVRKVEKGVREESGNSREIVNSCKGVDVFSERSSVEVRLRESVMGYDDTHHTLCRQAIGMAEDF